MRFQFLHADEAVAESEVAKRFANMPRGSEYVCWVRRKPRAPVSELQKVLGDQDFSVRVHAALDLMVMGPEAQPAIRELLQLLEDEDEAIRNVATEALERIGKPAIPELIAALNHEAGTVRRGAVWALGKIGVEAERVLRKLMPLLHDPNDRVREATAWILGRMGAEAESTLPELVKLLTDDIAYVRNHTAHALTRIAPQSEVVITALLDGLNNDNPDVRAVAAETLGEIGGAAAKASVPALKRAVEDKDKKVRRQASFALQKILGREADQ